jgi:hypothetical protein
MALILHPCRRTAWLQQQWPTTRAEKALWSAKKLWERYRDGLSIFSVVPHDDITQLSQKSHREKEKRRDERDVFYQIKEQRVLSSRPRTLDEYDEYCSESLYDPGTPPLQWWLHETQRKRWPKLSTLAIEILSIPAMSAEPERIFSGGRRTMRWDRGQLSIETLEMLECQKNWKGKVFPQTISN